MILIEQQQIPADFVRSTVTGYADQRIQSLTQQILSRTKLWEIIQQFNLYPEMQEKRTREEMLEKMRQSIRIETISAEVADMKRGGKATIAFSISFRDKNPSIAQKVTGTLASIYLEQNLKNREAQAQSTTQFLEAELKELQERIRVLGGKITAFKQKHGGSLPELQQFNLSQAERIESEIKHLEVTIRATEDRKIYLEGQLASVKPNLPVTATGERVMSPSARLQALEVALADLQSKFSEDHPDIRKVRREMAELRKLTGRKEGGNTLREQKIAELKAELAKKQGRYSNQHPEVIKLNQEIALLEKSSEKDAPQKPGGVSPENPAYISLSTQIQTAANDIAALNKQKAVLTEKLKMYRDRLEAIPRVEQEYLALQRDYANAHAKHQEVMNKILEARIAEGMEQHQKGEKFTIIDPASYPEKPVSPPRVLIFLAGVLLSLGSGIGMVSLSEHMDHSVKNRDELARLTGQPVLGTIARIWTSEDFIRAQRKRKLILAVIAFSLTSGLLLFHFLYLDLWVLSAKLIRIFRSYS